nr:MAG TPA: hypothetical protein [Caudoviricetes sp.]
MPHNHNLGQTTLFLCILSIFRDLSTSNKCVLI